MQLDVAQSTIEALLAANQQMALTNLKLTQAAIAAESITQELVLINRRQAAEINDLQVQLNSFCGLPFDDHECPRLDFFNAPLAADAFDLDDC